MAGRAAPQGSRQGVGRCGSSSATWQHTTSSSSNTTTTAIGLRSMAATGAIPPDILVVSMAKEEVMTSLAPWVSTCCGVPLGHPSVWVSVLLGIPCHAAPPWYADMDVCQPLFFQRLAYSTWAQRDGQSGRTQVQGSGNWRAVMSPPSVLCWHTCVLTCCLCWAACEVRRHWGGAVSAGCTMVLPVAGTGSTCCVACG